MEMRDSAACTAFEGVRRLASGPTAEVALAAKAAFDRGGLDPILVLDDATGLPVEVDYGGTADDLRRQTEPGGPAAPRGPGRPKLGVVAREVTLLPRHWDWLTDQPGGASVALRKLVDAARHAGEGPDRVRRSREAAYRAITALAGDLPGFEEANRALFAGDRSKFESETASWPPDVRDHARRMAGPSFEGAEGA